MTKDPASLPSSPEPRGLKSILTRLRSAPSVVPAELEGLIRHIRDHHPRTGTDLIVRSYAIASAAHEGQVRLTGEPYITHPLAVAGIVSELGMDPTTIAAALLHDAVEDTSVDLEGLRAELGDPVADLVDGLTKIAKIGFLTSEEAQASNLRKMIVAMARDLRVIIIKLADRLHNLRTLKVLPEDKQQFIANETLEIYAPLAHRLGMQHVQGELEDLSFSTLHPKRYNEIRQMVELRQPERQAYLDQVLASVSEHLAHLGLSAEVTGRPKHYYSIYEKMVHRGHEFEEILDLVGMRIIVDELSDCYAALGAVHSLWKPLPGRFKDFVAMPKFNLYQSLHTAVVGPDGKPLEIQIRTHQMHRVAEWGVAAHWRYKEELKGETSEEQAAWLQRMVELEQTEDHEEFLRRVRMDLFSDEVFVFTPGGDVIELSKGATPIDFAYAVHTEVGHACVGAKVDGKLASLDYRLRSGETVEIVTAKQHTGPSRDWLAIAVTPRARTKIRQWFARERREEASTEGKEAITKALRKEGLPLQRVSPEGRLEAVAAELHLPSLEALYVEVGEGRLSAANVVMRVARAVEPAQELEEEVDPRPAGARGSALPPAVLVKGESGVMAKLARCCTPMPGDSITGFITRGRGVSVHRQDCPNLVGAPSEPHRFIEVSWDRGIRGTFVVTVRVEAIDRPKLLRDVTTAISDHGVNIISATSKTAGGIAVLGFTLELADTTHLDHILVSMRRVEAVYDAYRQVPQAP